MLLSTHYKTIRGLSLSVVIVGLSLSEDTVDLALDVVLHRLES